MVIFSSIFLALIHLVRSWRPALQNVDLYNFGGAEHHRESIEASFQSFHEVTRLIFLITLGLTNL